MAARSQPDTFEVTDYLGVLRRRGWVVALLAIVGAAAAAAYLVTATKSYTATSSVYVNVNAANANQLQGSRTSGAAVNMDNEAQFLQSNVVAGPAAKVLHSRLSPDQLLKEITVTVPANTTVLQISCTTHEPRTSAACAEAFGESYLTTRRQSAQSKITFELDHLRELEAPLQAKSIKLRNQAARLPDASPQRANIGAELKNVNSQLGALRADISSVNASVNYNPGYVISPAAVPLSASDPKPMLYLPSGLLAGLLLGLIIAFILDRRDDRIHTVSDLERACELPLLFKLPLKKLPQQTGLMSPRSRAGRSFTELAEAIVAGLGEGNHVIVIANPSLGHQSSVITANLAATLARTRADTLLLCADVTGSITPRLLGIGPGRGLADVVSGTATIGDVMRCPAEIGRLSVITPGEDTAPLLTQLDQGTRRRLVADLRRDYSYVLIDAAAAGESSDIFSLAEFADAAVIAAQIGYSRRPDIADTVARLDRMRTPVLGAAVLPPSEHRTREKTAATYSGGELHPAPPASPVRPVEEPRAARPSQASRLARDIGAAPEPLRGVSSRPVPPRRPREVETARKGETLPMPRVTSAEPPDDLRPPTTSKSAGGAERSW